MKQLSYPKVAYWSLFALVALAFMLFGFKDSRTAEGAAIPGTRAVVATTSSLDVGPSVQASGYGTAFATSTCTSRIVSTKGQAVMLTFSDNQGAVPSGTFGFPQAASTTIAYDADVFGCSAWRIYGFSASTTIQISETR